MISTSKGVIEPSQLVDLISSLPQPLGCLNATPFEVEIMCRHITDDAAAFDYSFTSVLLALNVYSLVHEHKGHSPGNAARYNPVETLRAIRAVRRALRRKMD